MSTEPAAPTDTNAQPLQLTQQLHDGGQLNHSVPQVMGDASTKVDMSDEERLKYSDWEPYREIIQDLYKSRPLKDVQQILQDKHGFEATLSQYKRKIDQWGFKKNKSSKDMELIVQSLAKATPRTLTTRSLDEGLQIGDQTVKSSQIKRFLKRQKSSSLPDEFLPRAATFPELSTSRLRIASPRSNYPRISTGISEQSNLLEKEEANTEEQFDLSTPVSPRTDNLKFGSSYDEAGFVDWQQIAIRGADSPKRKRSHSQAPSNYDDNSGRLFACPFHKFDPNRYSEKNTTESSYRKCAQAVLRGIPRVKQHLYRTHSSLYTCPRCQEEFQSSIALQEHSRQAKSCLLSSKPFSEKITKIQENEIRRRRIGKDDTENWYEIYKILFPGAPMPESPFAGDNETDDYSTLQHFVNLFKAVGPDVSRLLQKASITTSLPATTRMLVSNAVKEAHPTWNDDIQPLSINTKITQSTTSTTGTKLFSLPESAIDHHAFSFMEPPALDTQGYDFELAWPGFLDLEISDMDPERYISPSYPTIDPDHQYNTADSNSCQ